MRADKSDKNGSHIEKDTGNQSTVVAFDVEDKQAVSHVVDTVEIFLRFCKVAPVCTFGDIVPSLQ